MEVNGQRSSPSSFGFQAMVAWGKWARLFGL
jgi:hypothetical protein